MSCLYCDNGHDLMSCLQFEKQPHREKINFVRQNGICFGCLTKGGHLSKDCTQHLYCSICNKQHPSVLHIKALESSKQLKKTPVSSTQVSLQDGKHAGVKSMQIYIECLLSIVPVQVKSSKGSKILHTYAFLDPGSLASFSASTEDLMRKLNITGRKTNILLRTMSQDKSVPSYIVSGLKFLRWKKVTSSTCQKSTPKRSCLLTHVTFPQRKNYLNGHTWVRYSFLGFQPRWSCWLEAMLPKPLNLGKSLIAKGMGHMQLRPY